MTSLTTLSTTLKAMANMSAAKATFPGRAALQDLAVKHVDEAARVLALLERHERELRAALGPVLPWEAA